MYCGFPATLLTSAYLHGPTCVDHTLFCDSSNAFANYSSDHLAIAFVKRNKAAGYDRLNGQRINKFCASLLVSVAIDSHRLILYLLKDLHAKILLKPLPLLKLIVDT